MEDIFKAISINLPFVKLYLNDIEKIISYLTQDKPTNITLEAEEKIFTFEEIAGLKYEKINNLRITAEFSGENFYIIFDKYGTEIRCHHNKTVYQGIAKKIEDYLKTKTRPFGKFAKSSIPHYITGGLLPFMPLFTIFIFYKAENINRNTKYLILVGATLLLIFFIVFVYLGYYYKNIIFTKEKHCYKNFFIRNKDQLFIQIIVVLLTAVFSFFLGRFSK